MIMIASVCRFNRICLVKFRECKKLKFIPSNTACNSKRTGAMCYICDCDGCLDCIDGDGHGGLCQCLAETDGSWRQKHCNAMTTAKDPSYKQFYTIFYKQLPIELWFRIYKMEHNSFLINVHKQIKKLQYDIEILNHCKSQQPASGIWTIKQWNCFKTVHPTIFMNKYGYLDISPPRPGGTLRGACAGECCAEMRREIIREYLEDFVWNPMDGAGGN